MLLKSRSTPGRGLRAQSWHGFGQTPDEKMESMIAEASATAPGGAAAALWDRVRGNVGRSGVDLAEDAMLRQAAVHAGNMEAGKPQGYARSSTLGTDDPRYGVQFRNAMGRATNTPAAALSVRARPNPLDFLLG